MRFLFILGGLNSGGTENYLLRLCRFVRETEDFRHLEISVLYNGKYHQLVPEFQSLGIRLFPFNGHPARRFNAASKIFAAESFDAVCTFTIPSFPALYQAKRQEIPVRAAFLRVRYRAGTLHQKTLPFPFNVLFDKMLIGAERFFLPKVATHIFSNSQTALNKIIGNTETGITDSRPLKTAVIRNGIPFPGLEEPFDRCSYRKLLGIPEGVKIVGHIAAFRPQKNHVLAVKAAQILCSSRQDVCFLFLGEGTTHGIPLLLKERRLADRILTFEPRNDIFNVLRLLDVFILPSFSEGQSNALMEAMGMGIPFVVSRCSENLEILPDGFEQYAVLSSDLDGFVRKIEDIIEFGWTEQQREICCRFARNICEPEQNFRQFLNELCPAGKRRD